MNFVAQVEEHLRDLGSEARKKHPGVKEASERAIISLRQLQNQYATAVRRSSSNPAVPHPTTALFRSQDVLRPFLLAANYPDAGFRLLTIALDAIDLLVRGDAVCPGDAVHVVRVVGIQGNVCAGALQQGIGGNAAESAAAAATSAVASTLTGLTGLAGSLAAGVGRSVGYGALGGGGDDSYSSSAGMTGSHSHRSLKEDEIVARRLVRTLTMIAEARGLDMTEEVLGQCIAVCLVLASFGGSLTGDDSSASSYGRPRAVLKADGNDTMPSAHGGKAQSGGVASVRKAAACALKMIVAAVFERVAEASRPLQHTELTIDGNVTNGEHDIGMNDGKSVDRTSGETSITLAGTRQRLAPSSTTLQNPEQLDALRSLAAQTFTDLCALAESQHKQFGAAYPPPNATQAARPRSGSSSGMPPGVTGPFAQALAGGMHHRVSPPPRSACLEVLDLVLIERTDLFRCGAGSGNEATCDFRKLLKSRACPLAAAALMEDSSAIDRSSPSAGASTAADFAMHLRSIKLASTIVAVCGTDDELAEECRILLTCLVRAVSAAAEAYRDTDGFEDGYVYSPSEQKRLNPPPAGTGGGSAKGQRSSAGKTVTGGRRAPSLGSQHHVPGQHAHGQRSKQRPAPRENVAVLTPTLWRAALSLESLYTLIDERFETLVWLHSSSYQSSDSGSDESNHQIKNRHPGHGTILTQMAEAISDFATVAASCRDSILGVVDAASITSSSPESIKQEIPYDEDSATDSTSALGLDPDADDESHERLGEMMTKGLIHPRIIKRANNAIRDDWGSLTSSAMMDDEVVDDRKHRSPSKQQRKNYLHDKSIGGAVKGSPAEVEGESIWIAYNSILSMTRSLLRLSLSVQARSSDKHAKKKLENSFVLNKTVVKSLVDSVFAPSLALFQHFLKRFPASSILVTRTLEGYTNLSRSSFPLRDLSAPAMQDDMHRRAILNSLCKLSLPHWGKKDGTCQLCDHHIAALSALFRITHVDADYVGSEWAVILSTWEQLSALAISSARLTASGYEDAFRLSGCFGRLSDFTTSLSTEGLVFVVKALVVVSNESVGRQVSRNSGGPLAAGETVNNDLHFSESNTKESLGGKLMRAITGGGTESGLQRDLEASSASNDPTHSAESSVHSGQNRSTKTHGEEFYSSVYERLFSSTKPTTRKEVFQKLPFSLVALTDIALANSFRFEEGCGAVTTHLCDLAAHSKSGDVRAFSMDTLANLITLRISGDRSGLAAVSCVSTAVPNPSSIDDYFCIIPPRPSGSIDKESLKNQIEVQRVKQGLGTSQAELVLPLCKTITSTDQHDTAEAGLNAVYVILEGAGHNLSGESWPLLINAIATLSGNNSTAAEKGLTDYTTAGIDRSTADWAATSALAFRCLKLTIDDFLDELPSSTTPGFQPTQAALLDCCAAFGSSRHDVNTSLTATGMLWTLADQDPSPSSLDGVLEKLALLSSDDRAEVRNCSVNTLFSCVVGLGESFTADQWEGCLCGTIFGVIDTVSGMHGQQASKVDAELKGEEVSNRYKVSVHHSRDSAEKQRATTQTLALRGLERVLRQFFPRLLATTAKASSSICVSQPGEQAWFDMALAHILSYAYSCATITTGGRDTLALRIAGADLMVLCVQLSCKAGLKASASPARVGTNMQVVNGALRSVKSALPDAPSGDDEGGIKAKSISKSIVELSSVETNAIRQQLFLAAFGSVERFSYELEKGSLQDEEDGSNRFAYVESSLLQVLTKFSQGMGKVYDCCQNEEMLPKPCKTLSWRISIPSSLDPRDASDLEGRLVDVVSIVARNSGGDAGSRFLTQAQRACLELLKKMSLNSSSVAFQELAVMGGRIFFMRCSSGNSDADIDDGDGLESLEFESAKVVADAFSSSGVPKQAKVAVLCTVLERFDEFLSGSSHAGGKPNFDLLVPVVQGGMDAASSLDRDGPSNEPSLDVLLDDAWKGMIGTLSGLVSPIDSAQMEGFSALMKAVLEITSSAISNVPEQYHAQLGAALANCSSDIVNVMKLFAAADVNTGAADKQEPAVAQQESCLGVFIVCFSGLCQCQPNADTLGALSEKFLRSAVEASANENTNAGASDALDSFDVEVEVALVVCSAIQSLPPPNDLALSLYAWLCRLTGSSNSSRLRKEAGELLGTVDVVGMMQRTLEAEYVTKELEKQNGTMTERIKDLELENEKLRHQAAMFAES